MDSELRGRTVSALCFIGWFLYRTTALHNETLNDEAIVYRMSQGPEAIESFMIDIDRLCGLVVRVLGYRSGGPGSIPGTTRRKNVVGLERGALNLVSTTEELLDRKVAATV
jgi:hypothetical protein